jgi:hypothetical protein
MFFYFWVPWPGLVTVRYGFRLITIVFKNVPSMFCRYTKSYLLLLCGDVGEARRHGGPVPAQVPAQDARRPSDLSGNQHSQISSPYSQSHIL